MGWGTYRSEGDTNGKDFRRPLEVSNGEGLPERRRKSSWSMVGRRRVYSR